MRNINRENKIENLIKKTEKILKTIHKSNKWYPLITSILKQAKNNNYLTPKQKKMIRNWKISSHFSITKSSKRYTARPKLSNVKRIK